MKSNASIDLRPCLTAQGNQLLNRQRHDERVKTPWRSKILSLTGFLLIAALLASSTLSYAAKPTPPPVGTGTLTGQVLIAGSRTPIPGATVTAEGDAASYETTTNDSGAYKLSPLPGGYSVTATADGYNGQTFSATVREGKRTKLNFSLSTVVSTDGTLMGTVRDENGPLAGATVATDGGGYSVQTDSAGAYSMDVAAGAYGLTASLEGYQAVTKAVEVAAGSETETDFLLEQINTALSITSLTAEPGSFDEDPDAGPIALTAGVDGTVTQFSWTQRSGPRVPLTVTDMTAASADVSGLEVAAECELVFELTVEDDDGNTVSETVSVSVNPVDMLQYPGSNVQIGGSTTAVERFQYGGEEWSLFNIGTALKATTVGDVKGEVYGTILPGTVYDIEIVDYTIDSVEQTYALVAVGSAGVAVVNITDPTAMSLVTVAPVAYEFGPVTYTEGGGTILYDNYFASDAGPVVALATDGVSLFIGDVAYGIHKTALEKVFSFDPEQIETLPIDAEMLTVQYAGEHAWGGPISLKLYGGKLFAGLGALGMGIFDPDSLKQIGRYNLYTDEARTEDYFGAMALTETVHGDETGLFLDAFTGMPDYRQVNYEVGVLMHGNLEDDTPWADFERDGKWYYEAVDVDVAAQAGRTIAYIAYSLGGVIAVDVSNFESATASNFLTAPYLGYFVAVPANGPYDTGSQPSSLLPYEGAGMLKESGVISVDVLGDRVFLTDHFAGLVILSDADTPDETWGAPGEYENNTDDIPDNNVPEFEDVTSYDMSPWDPDDNESLPWAYYQAPVELATRELNGHGYDLALMDADAIDLVGSGGVDVLECSTAGGLVFVDVFDADDPEADMAMGFTIAVAFPTTDEVGAAPDGSATEAITLGHTDGIAATDDYIYVSDGPHGITAWKITDDEGYPTDEVHVVANTLQDEYPIEVDGEWIYPASHTVRNVIDPDGAFTWALSVGNGMRRVPIAAVEAGVGAVGAPLLMKLYVEDSFEHNGDLGVVDELNYQDQAYDVEFVGNYAYVADGTNGLTIYDTSQTPDPMDATSGFFVANIGYNQGSPLLGTASGIELWTDPDDDGKRYAVLACGPNGVGVVDITDVNNLKIVKVFEPIKYEDGDLGSADGQAIDVEVVGDIAYFGYDSFGLVAYSMADLVEPVPAGVNPTELFKKRNNGIVFYDYRPDFLGKFKLQEEDGFEDVDGGSVKMAYTQQDGKLFFYAAFGHYGVVKIDYTDPEAPFLEDAVPTASECVDVEIANGRLYVGDHAGGLVLFK
ncbi:MAG: carboxypeptidase regulatory-like domain-containing protein [Xanthomonadales bacterium]